MKVKDLMFTDTPAENLYEELEMGFQELFSDSGNNIYLDEMEKASDRQKRQSDPLESGREDRS